MATASLDKTVKLWNITTFREIKTLTGHTEAIWGVSFSPNKIACIHLAIALFVPQSIEFQGKFVPDVRYV
jgi:WD40 repeat protein